MAKPLTKDALVRRVKSGKATYAEMMRYWRRDLQPRLLAREARRAQAADRA